MNATGICQHSFKLAGAMGKQKSLGLQVAAQEVDVVWNFDP